MNNASFFFYNNQFIEDKNEVFSSFQQYKGFFESIKFINKNCALWQRHCARMEASFKQLNFTKPINFSYPKLLTEIENLIDKNNLSNAIKIKVVFFEEESVYNYAIQAQQLFQQYNTLNIDGLIVDFYEQEHLSTHSNSNIKNNERTIYKNATNWATSNSLNDVILLNTNNEIVETTIANIFFIMNDGNIITPKLQQGCVAGVYRNLLLEKFNFIKEIVITKNDVMLATEAFTTNAIREIQWIKKIGNKELKRNKVKELFELLKHKS